MDWDQPLSRTLTLKSGDELHTLQDAAEAFLRRFGNVHHDAPIAWGIELMMTAARTGDEADRIAATEQGACGGWISGSRLPGLGAKLRPEPPNL